MDDSFGQTYGRWEFRARTDHGRGFGSAILLWPDSEKQKDGEIDIAEVPAEQRDQAHFVLHSGPDGGDTLDRLAHGGRLLAVAHVRRRLAALITSPGTSTDGPRFTVTDRAHIPNTPMHLAIQLDQGPVKDWMPAPDATTPPPSAAAGRLGARVLVGGRARPDEDARAHDASPTAADRLRGIVVPVR